MNEVVPIILAIIGILAGAYAALAQDVRVAGGGIVLVGLAVVLPLIFK